MVYKNLISELLNMNLQLIGFIPSCFEIRNKVIFLEYWINVIIVFIYYIIMILTDLFILNYYYV